MISVRFHTRHKSKPTLMLRLLGWLSPTFRHVTVKVEDTIYDFGPDGMHTYKDGDSLDKWYPPVMMMQLPDSSSWLFDVHQRARSFTRFRWLTRNCVTMTAYVLRLRGPILTPDRLFRRLLKEGWRAV